MKVSMAAPGKTHENQLHWPQLETWRDHPCTWFPLIPHSLRVLDGLSQFPSFCSSLSKSQPARLRLLPPSTVAPAIQSCSEREGVAEHLTEVTDGHIFILDLPPIPIIPASAIHQICDAFLRFPSQISSHQSWQ